MVALNLVHVWFSLRALCFKRFFEGSSSQGIRERQRGVENSGEGKHAIKSLPTNGFLDPPTFGTSLALYRGEKGLSLENPQKESEKGLPGPLGPGAEKARNRVENDYFSSFFRVLGLFFDSFSSFFSPRAERPREPFFRLFLGVF